MGVVALVLVLLQDPLEAERIRGLIFELGSDTPQRREEATRGLMLTGRQALDAVQKALAQTKEPEARKRLESLCTYLGATSRVTPERLRQTKIDFDVRDASAADVLMDFMRQSGIPIEVLLHNSREIRLRPTRHSGASIEEVIGALAKELGCQWSIVHERKVVLHQAPGPLPAGVSLKFYDTRAITFRILDSPVVPDEMGVFVEQPAEAQPRLGGEDLVQLIRDSVAKESWDEEGRSIIFQNGILVAVTTADIHAKIEAYLKKVRKDFSLQVKTELVVVAHKPEFMADVLDKSPRMLTTEQFEAILKSEGESMTLVGHLQLTGFQNQRILAQSGSERLYVSGYHEGQPRHEALFEGLRVNVKGTLSDDRKTVAVNLRGFLSKVLALEKVKTEAGEVQVPRKSQIPLRASPAVECGVPIVLAQVGPVQGYGDGRTQILVIVRVTSVLPD
jgi:hypothetical protein